MSTRSGTLHGSAPLPQRRHRPIDTGRMLRPPKTRTRGRRGRTRAIPVSGQASGRVSTCYQAGERARPIYRAIVCTATARLRRARLHRPDRRRTGNSTARSFSSGTTSRCASAPMLRSGATTSAAPLSSTSSSVHTATGRRPGHILTIQGPWSWVLPFAGRRVRQDIVQFRRDSRPLGQCHRPSRRRDPMT